MKFTEQGASRFELLRGDITLETVDAIVNAANTRLIGGGGVDGAIHDAGGPAIMEDCDRIRAERGGCPTGTAVITTAGRLRAKCVIHTAGPVWNGAKADECDRLLVAAYRSCLELAVVNRMRSVAFPSISTGVYGFPIARAAPLVLRAVRDFVSDQPIELVRFVLYSTSDLAVYERALDEMCSSAT